MLQQLVFLLYGDTNVQQLFAESINADDYINGRRNYYKDSDLVSRFYKLFFSMEQWHRVKKCNALFKLKGQHTVGWFTPPIQSPSSNPYPGVYLKEL